MSDRTDFMATVTAVAPLRVRRDREAAPIPVSPVDLVGGLQVGNRVYAANIDGQLFVVGRPGGPALPGRLSETNNLGAGNDPDAITDTGFYSGYNWTGSLAGYGIGTLEVIKYTADWVTQVFTAHAAVPLRYLRVRHSGTTWSPWRQLATMADVEAAKSTWAAYTPTYSGFTLGNGLLVARSNIMGKSLDVAITLTVGSTTTISGPTVAFSTPGNWINSTVDVTFEWAAHNMYKGFGLASGTSLFIYGITGASLAAAVITATAPWGSTWATGDVFKVYARGEIA